MPVVTEAKGDIDEVAKKVFERAIEVVGGLRKLIEHRHLTWLPSLAEAAYVVVLREMGGKTSKSIAAELGITEATVRNISAADPEAVRRYLEGELEEISEHVAGGLAKLAFKQLREEGAI
ncbi:regulatory domain protein [Candidatus Poribacteria bacterium]|nr:MAG: regulatory domain protein [Candidatus Poribacteria bacterium]